MNEDSKGVMYITLLAVVAIVGMVALKSGGGVATPSWGDTEEVIEEYVDEEGNLVGEARYRRSRNSRASASTQGRLSAGTRVVRNRPTTTSRGAASVRAPATTSSRSGQNAVSVQQISATAGSGSTGSNDNHLKLNSYVPPTTWCNNGLDDDNSYGADSADPGCLNGNQNYKEYDCVHGPQDSPVWYQNLGDPVLGKKCWYVQNNVTGQWANHTYVSCQVNPWSGKTDYMGYTNTSDPGNQTC